jgi:hypothetical protein
MGLGLKVPLQVDALVVEDDRLQRETWAASTAAEPFTTGTRPARGVHLNWALPDGLTRGEAVTKDGRVEQLALPSVPDRWLVVRFDPPDRHRKRGRSWRAWVVDAFDGTQTPLDDWRPPAAGARRTARLTAGGFQTPDGRMHDAPPEGGGPQPVGAGSAGPVWAAYYPDTPNRFGFHDPLEGVAGGPLSYAVVGWYSDLDDDPLHAAGRAWARRAWVEERRWTVEGPIPGLEDEIRRPPVDVARLPELLPELVAVDPRGPIGPTGPEGPRPVPETPVFRPPEVLRERTHARRELERARLAERETLRSLAEVTGESATAPQAAPLVGSPGDTPSFDLQMLRRDALELSHFGFSVVDAGAALNVYEFPYPDRIYCHGTLVGVSLGGSGGDYHGPHDDPRPADAPTAVVGRSVPEAMARLMAASSDVGPLLEAVHAGLLRELTTTDGVQRLQQLLHQQEFASFTAAPQVTYVADVVDSGFVHRDKSGSREITLAELPADVKSVQVAERQLSTLVGERLRAASDRAARVTSVTRKELGVLIQTPVAPGKRWRLREVLLPRPRWWKAVEPILLLHGPKRTYRHGHDGRLDAEGRLACRVTGQTVEEIAADLRGLVAGAGVDGIARVRAGAVLAATDRLQRLAPTVRELVEEAVLLDPTNAPLFAATSARAGRLDSQGEAQAAARFRVEAEYWWSAALPGVDAARVAQNSLYGGVLPSPIAVRPYRPSWGPLFLDWEVRVHPDARPVQQGWRLGEVEHAPLGALHAAPAPLVVAGRSYPTAHAARTLADAIDQVVQGDGPAAGGVGAADLTRLHELAARLDRLDVLSCPLDGLDLALHEAGLALRAGTLELARVRLVDTFGQTYELPPEALRAATGDRVAVVGATAEHILLPPRLPYPARFLFRWMDGEGGAAEAGPTVSPVCGFLLPDHVEHAVEVFDAAGSALGQLRHVAPADPAAAPRFVWEPAPGTEAALGDRAAAIPNAYLRAFVQALLDRDLATPPDAGPDTETALSALVRVIDTVQHTVDRVGDTDEFVSTLVGRPVALARARLTLETSLPRGADPADPLPAPAGLEARLGSLTQLDDGLLGWLAAGDPAVLHPPHASVREKARVSGRRRGWLVTAGAGPALAPITHAYVAPDPTADVVAGEPQDLLLLLDPRSGVHATTGVLPRKRIALDREHTEAALARLAPTFRVGPVLVDPARLALPVPGFERFDWSWTRRERPPSGPDGWSATPVAAASDAAVVPDRPALVHDGWLRLGRDPDDG